MTEILVAASLWNEYLRPDSLEDALAALHAARGAGRVLAGGTDLLLDLQQGRLAPIGTLVDVTAVPELRALLLDGGVITLGAGLTHREIVDSLLLQEHAVCLVEACALIGGPQVRNVATLGGNVAHALPAGDGTIALLALDAQAEVASRAGRRWLPLEALFAGPGRTTFDRSEEILTAFRFAALEAGEGTAFRRVMRPQGVAIAILNMAAWLQRGDDGSVSAARLSVGPAGPRPLRARRAEAALVGRPLSAETLRAAGEALLAEAQLRSSPHRATSEYRVLLIETLLRRTLHAAWEAACARSGEG